MNSKHSHVGVDPVVDASPLPYRCASYTVLQQVHVTVRSLHKQHRTYMIGLFRGQPYGCGLLAPHHQVDVILCAKAMRDSRQETVRVGREVHSCEFRLEVEDGTYEGRVLV